MNNLPTLHLPGLAHTVVSNRFSHCAFTGKILRFSKMMQTQGFRVVEYSNEGSESEAREKHEVLKEVERQKLVALHKKEFPTDVANVSSTLYKEYNKRLLDIMAPLVKPGDIICHAFGPAYHPLMAIQDVFHVETGIGYTNPWADYRIYESYSHWHYIMGKQGIHNGSDYNWVIPNYYDLDEWDVNLEVKDPYILYMGRLNTDKGMDIIRELSNHVTIPIIVCGQGDPNQFKGCKNIMYKPPIAGRERSELVGNALCMIMPTRYIEPFGGAGIEGMLCGTPLIASDFGAFSETVIPGVTGFRCKTLKDWINAIKAAGSLGRARVANTARSKYGLLNIGTRYKHVFKQITDLKGNGWYTM